MSQVPERNKLSKEFTRETQLNMLPENCSGHDRSSQPFEDRAKKMPAERPAPNYQKVLVQKPACNKTAPDPQSRTGLKMTCEEAGL
jgi:hypothetical protein